MKNSDRRIAQNTLILYCRMLITMIISFFTLRIVIQTLGVNDYGIYTVVGGIVTLFTFINAGLSGATKRYILAELANGDIRSQIHVFNSAFKAHIIIAFLILLIGETIGVWFLNSRLNISVDRLYSANIIFHLSLLTSILTILQSPFTSVIISHEKMGIFAYFSIIDVGFKLLIIYLIPNISGDKLIVYALLLLVISFFNLLLNLFYCLRKIPMCRFVYATDNGQLKNIFLYMGWQMFGQGAYVCSSQGVVFLINIFYSVTVNAAYGISNNIINVVTQFVTNFQMAFTPQLTKNYISNNDKDLFKFIQNASKYSSYLLLYLVIPLIITCENVLNIWLGTYPDYSVVFCKLTLICIFLECASSPLTIAISSDCNIKRYQLMISMVHMVNVLLCWFFLYKGFWPYVIIFIRMFVDVLLIMVRIFVLKRNKNLFNPILWIQNTYVYPVIITLITFCILSVFNKYIFLGDFLRIILIGFLSILINTLLVYNWGLNKDEKKAIIGYLKRF